MVIHPCLPNGGETNHNGCNCPFHYSITGGGFDPLNDQILRFAIQGKNTLTDFVKPPNHRFRSIHDILPVLLF